MPKKKKLTKVTGLLGFALLVLPIFSFAAVSQGGWQVPNVPGLSTRSVSEILLTFIDWAIKIIGLLGVIIFIYGGFTYLTAQGESSSLEKAKRIIIYGIVGIAVAVLGLVVVRTIDGIIKGSITGGGGSNPSSMSGDPDPTQGDIDAFSKPRTNSFGIDPPAGSSGTGTNQGQKPPIGGAKPYTGSGLPSAGDIRPAQ